MQDLHHVQRVQYASMVQTRGHTVPNGKVDSIARNMATETVEARSSPCSRMEKLKAGFGATTAMPDGSRPPQ